MAMARLFRSALRLGARLLPAAIRRPLSARLRRFLSGDGLPTPVNPYVLKRKSEVQGRTDGINIVGYVRSEHGVGESVRSCARAANAAALSFSLHDFNAGNQARTSDDTWVHCLTPQPNHAVSVFHINADQMPLASITLGRRFFRDRYNIGYWAWELPDFPDRWAGSFAHVDEVWSPSQFVVDAIALKAPVPVVRMPHAIDFQTDPRVRRSDLGLPENRFLFLTMYDTQSFQARKNPEGAVEAFRRAFPRAGEAGLVVKINHPQTHGDDVRRLKTTLARVPGVVLIDRTLSRPDVYNLLGLCDSFVSLHRAEGFGLGMAEAMFLGKPVVATHWSGNVDFMTVANSCPVGYDLVTLQEDVGPYARGQTWAEPDLDDAAAHMRRLVDDAAWRRQIGDCGRQTIREHFSPAAVGRLYRARLAVIRQMLNVRPPNVA